MLKPHTFTFGQNPAKDLKVVHQLQERHKGDVPYWWIFVDMVLPPPMAEIIQRQVVFKLAEGDRTVECFGHPLSGVMLINVAKDELSPEDVASIVYGDGDYYSRLRTAETLVDRQVIFVAPTWNKPDRNNSEDLSVVAAFAARVPLFLEFCGMRFEETDHDLQIL